jgi:hypothetical protein
VELSANRMSEERSRFGTRRSLHRKRRAQTARSAACPVVFRVRFTYIDVRQPYTPPAPGWDDELARDARRGEGLYSDWDEARTRTSGPEENLGATSASRGNNQWQDIYRCWCQVKQTAAAGWRAEAGKGHLPRTWCNLVSYVASGS